MPGLWVDTNPNVRKRADYDDDNDDNNDDDNNNNNNNNNNTLWTAKQIRWKAETQISPHPAASELTLVQPQSAILYRYQSLVFRGVEPSDNILESCAKSKNVPILIIIPPDT